MIIDRVPIIDRIKPAHFFVFAFIFYAAIVLFSVPGQILFDDEAFYYFQSKAVAYGEPAYFHKTNPYLFPYILSGLSGLGPVTMRLIPAFFMSAALGVYYNFLRKNGDKVTAFIAPVLLAFNFRVIEFSVQMYTESMLIFFLFLSFDKAVDIIRGKDAWKDYLMLGVYMGLLLETKALIPIVPLFFFAWLVIYAHGMNTAKAAVSSVIAAAIYLPYFVLNGNSYFFDKFQPPADLAKIAQRVALCPEHFGIIFATVLVAAGFYFLRSGYHKRNYVFNVMFYFTIIYLFFVIFVVSYVFSRYYFLCLPLVVYIVARCISDMNSGGKAKRLLAVLIPVMLLASSLAGIGRIPGRDRNVHFLPGYSVRHLELRTAKQTYLCGMYSGAKATVRTLPVFDQENYTLAEYDFNFFVPGDGYRYIFFSHICDKIRIILDGKEPIIDIQCGPHSPYQLNLSEPLRPGRHKLQLYITNDNNIGGIGQVVLFDEDISNRLGLSSIIDNARI